nr:hypothetical protein [Tanacetum cinerariifolium]
MILNTLDNLGKFEEKGDEGYFIGYSMSSKAFRVFNKRTRKVEENLHVEFLENKAIEKGTKDVANQEVKKDVSSLRYIALPNWVHDALLESSSSKPQDDCSTDVPESSGNSNPTATSTNPPADQLETLTVETPIPTISSPIPTACFTDSSKPSSDARLISKRVINQVETLSLDNILTLANQFEDILEVTTNSDEPNGVEADVSNIETTITANPEFPAKVYKVEKAMYGLHQAPRAWVLVNKSQNKTPYELLNGRTHAIGFLKPFGCHVMILNTLDNLGKFEAKGDEGYFIGYSMSSKAFRVFNKRTRRIDENLNVEFLENKAIEKDAGPNWLFDINSLTKYMNYVPVDAVTNSTNLSGTKDAARQEVKKDVSSLRYIALPNWVHNALLKYSSSKPQDDCSTDVPESSGNFNPTATLTNSPADQLETLTVETPILTVSSPVPTACFSNSPEPSSDTRLISKRVANQVEIPSLDNILTLTNRFKNILGVTKNSVDSNGVEADVSNMETTITASPTPTLKIHKDHPKSQIIGPVDTPIQTKNKSKEVRPIRTKWVLKNKKDERGIVIRNKSRLVVQGHTQKEGIDYDEVFAPIVRIEAIRLFLAYASFMGFTIYQMDVKSAFLYGTIDEEVYVMQPPGFQDPEFPAKVYKVEKAMYGLH